MVADRILTVALNAAVDVSYIVDGFGVDKINIARATTKNAGGKANNVARVLASLGQPVIATGLACGSAGQFIAEDLRIRSVEPQFVAAPGESRTCMAIVDPMGHTLTELREKGPTLTAADADRFLEKFTGLLGRAKLVVMSGSLPPGIPADFYGKLIHAAYRQTQVRTILDASGRSLAEALAMHPYLVKPNRDELEEWAGRPLPDEGALLSAAQDLIKAGPLTVAVSLGPEGLLMVSPEGAWRAVPPRITPVNTVGSGDSLVAGFAAGLVQGLSAEEILRLAVACGTANALTSEVAVVDPADLERIRPQVRVERVG